MKRVVSIFVLLSSLLILQGCCSLKIPGIEDKLPFIDELTCAGKGNFVSLDRIIIRLKIPPIGMVRPTVAEIENLMEKAFPGKGPFEIKHCECGDPDLMMIILNEPVENKGDLLTSVQGLREGGMNTDPALVYKLKHSAYHKIPKSPGGPLNPDITGFISDESDAKVMVVLDSGLDLNQFAKEEFLFPNPTGLDCITGSEPSSGFNFVDNNTIIQDNEDKSHGTFVTKTILEKSGVTYKILPLKIAKNRLVSYFDLLCAMSFAKQLKEQHEADIKIINASFGFKLKRNLLDLVTGTSNGGQMHLLKKYVDDFSEDAIFVTSAGNNHKNVDNNLFTSYYPAGFNSDNLIAVGGIKQIPISKHPHSNYGTRSIDIAAPYEHIIDNEPVGGTSIGAAQISASIANYWNQHPNFNPIRLKNEFLDDANDNYPDLKNYFKDGKYEQ
jgi:hypothetical protein